MDVEEIELFKEVISEQKQLGFKKARAKFRTKIKFQNTETPVFDKLFEKYWKIL